MGLVVVSGGQDLELADPLPWPTPNYTQLDLYGTGASYATIWRTQPAVRKVTGFLARNIAQLGLHSFHRIDDTERERLPRSHPLSRTIRRPAPKLTRYRWVNTLIHDLSVYDRYVAAKFKSDDGRVEIRRFRPRAVTPRFGGWDDPELFWVTGSSGRRLEIPADACIYVRGYNPDGGDGVAPMETLRRVLADELAAQTYREQLWRRGARMSGIIERPDGREWSDPARARFKADWDQAYAGNGPSAGGTPILEDGMTFKETAFSARDSEYIPGRIFNETEVATFFHIPPPMVGLLEHATYSNISEQHKQLYQDTLGPRLKELEEEFELQLVAEFEGSDDIYLEFNLAEKLKGSFEEQAAALSSLVGGPVMTRSEGRARLNLPKIDDPAADQLITPLNVLVGGQASPRDSAPPPKSGLKALATRSPVILDRWDVKQHDVVGRFLRRQAAAVLSALGAASKTKALVPLQEVWDEQRWNDELTVDLLAVGLGTASAGARTVIDMWDPQYEFDDAPMVPFVHANSERLAKAINATTRETLVVALQAEDPLDAVGQMFVVRAATTVDVLAERVTNLGNFGRNDAARALGLAGKTWTTTQDEPLHDDLAGTRVPLGAAFENGARWPGEPILPADQRAGCQCICEFDARKG